MHIVKLVYVYASCVNFFITYKLMQMNSRNGKETDLKFAKCTDVKCCYNI